MQSTIKLIMITAVCGIFSAHDASGQMSVTNSAPFNTTTHLIKNVFLGGDIEVMNLKFNGSTNNTISSNQVGYFSNAGNIIGIDSGIVMSTGNIFSIPQNTFASTSYGGIGDNDVLAVAQSVPWGTPPTVTRDRAILEFDFIAPADDSVAFEYCFASEEWPSYPCSSFNDAFGFFISGPGISGPYSNNAVNVAIIPGTDTLPVAITSIHNGTGSYPCNGNPSYNQYYNTGPTSNPFAFALSNNNNTSGAFTDVFITKPVAVNACDTYHVKMAICDGQDWIFDSAVFLKAKSFSFLGISVSPEPTYNPFGYDTALYEGCGDLDLRFSRTDSTYAPYTLSYQIAGTATMGLDYSMIPGCVPNGNGGYDCTITFPQDSASVKINIDILYDNLIESYETFIFIVTDSNVTNCLSGDTLVLTIVDQPDLQVNAWGNTTLDCNDPPAVIGVTATGLPPFDYVWSNGVADSVQSVQPSQTSMYAVTVTDACGMQMAVDFVTVGVFNVPWTANKIGDNQSVSCVDPPAVLAVDVTFADSKWHGDISYQWSTGSTDSVIAVHTNVDTTYTVTITRNCTGESVVKKFHLYAENDPVTLQTPSIPSDSMKCPGDIVEIKVIASGGYPPYTYTWETGATSDKTYVGPYEDRYYRVTVNDVCGLVDYVDSVFVEVPKAEPLRILGVVNDTIPCAGLKVNFGPAIPKGGFGWGYTFSWDDFNTESNYLEEIINADKSYTIKLIDGCGVDTGSLTVHGVIAKKNNLRLVHTIDTTVCKGDAIVLEAKGKGGGGKYVYYWNGSRQPSSRLLTITPSQPRTYTVRVSDQCDTFRTATISVDVSEIEADFEYEYLSDYEVKLVSKTWSTDSIVAWTWQIPDAGVSATGETPTVLLPDGAAYETTLMAVNQIGCEDRATMIVKPDFFLYVPNSFTPNGDFINDSWSVKSLGIREMKLEVYSQWGDVVFSTTDKHFAWDGKKNGQPVTSGVYVWRIVLYTDNGEYVEREGVVTVLGGGK
ncbi:MAG: hypothetical protein Kow0075_00810 [Salibacteraceae bacterium]